MMNTIAQMTWGQSALAWSLILVCGFLMLIILIQRGRGGGLTGAFGGGGGGGGAFGAKTGDVFTWITVVVAMGFGLLAVVSNFAFDQSPRPLEPVVSTTDVVPVEPAKTGEDGAPVMPPAGVAPETAGETAGEAGGDAVPGDTKENRGGSTIDQMPTAVKTPDAGGDEPAGKAQDPPAETGEGSETPTEPSAP